MPIDIFSEGLSDLFADAYQTQVGTQLALATGRRAATLAMLRRVSNSGSAGHYRRQQWSFTHAHNQLNLIERGLGALNRTDELARILDHSAERLAERGSIYRQRRAAFEQATEAAIEEVSRITTMNHALAECWLREEYASMHSKVPTTVRSELALYVAAINESQLDRTVDSWLLPVNTSDVAG